MPTFGEHYAKSPSIVYREIAGESILVPIRNNVGDLESIYTLNETASRVWELIDGDRSLGEIRDAIVDEYEVEAEEPDAAALVNELPTVRISPS